MNFQKKNYTNCSRIYYKKVGARQAQAISKISFAALLKENNGVITDIRAAFGAVGITVVRKKECENHIIGTLINDLSKKSKEFVSFWEPFIKPIDDQRSTAAYRKKVCLNLLEDFFRGGC